MQREHTELLRLAAQDKSDLEVISALLQDAIVAGTDMHFDTVNSCFLLVVNRFCWERPALEGVNSSGGDTVRERALCGLHIRSVVDVQKRQWPLDWKNAFFNILALECRTMSKQHNGWSLEFKFSGGPSLRMLTRDVNVVLGDLDNGRPTNLKPTHDL